MLKIAVPNKGSLADPSIAILKEAGYRQRVDSRDLILADPENGVEFYYLRPRDIALYVGTGDGGSGGDPQRVALDIASPLGKILSLSPTAKNEKTNDLVVWSRGLRNPWRFEFDASNNLWIADVGQNMWEEVNVAWATQGAGKDISFGWSAWEGNTRYNTDEPAQPHQKPVFTYKHGDAGCSISGGTRVRDPQLPAWKDWFVFGDYCSGRITAIWVSEETTQKQVVVQRNVGSITAVCSTAQGKVFVLTLDGKVLQLVQR